MSSEEFFRFNKTDIVKLKDYFNFFDEIEIIVYLRNQLDHIESSYKFSILWEYSQLQDSFSEYLEHQLASDYHCYDVRLMVWKEIFAHGKMAVYEFDQEIKKGLLNSFYKSVFNIDLFLEEKKDNTSLSRFSSLILHLKNSSNWSLEERREYIKRLRTFDSINPLIKKEKIYSREQYTKLLEKFNHSNNIIKSLFDVNLNEKMRNLQVEYLVGENMTSNDMDLIEEFNHNVCRKEKNNND